MANVGLGYMYTVEAACPDGARWGVACLVVAGRSALDLARAPAVAAALGEMGDEQAALMSAAQTGNMLEPELRAALERGTPNACMHTKGRADWSVLDARPCGRPEALVWLSNKPCSLVHLEVASLIVT